MAKITMKLPEELVKIVCMDGTEYESNDEGMIEIERSHEADARRMGATFENEVEEKSIGVTSSTALADEIAKLKDENTRLHATLAEVMSSSKEKSSNSGTVARQPGRKVKAEKSKGE